MDVASVKLLLGHADRSHYLWHAGRCASAHRGGAGDAASWPHAGARGTGDLSPKIEPLGLEFAQVGPTLDPDDPQQVADLMDIHKGTERTLRDVLFPAIRQSYDELRPRSKQRRRRPDACGRAHLPGAGGRGGDGRPLGQLCAGAALVFSAYDAPVLRHIRGWPAAKRCACHRARRHSLCPLGDAHWAEPVYQLRAELGLDRGANVIFDAKHAPSLVLAMFSPLLGEPQPDWPPNTEITGFVFYDGDAGKQELPLELEEFLQAGEPPVIFTLGSAAVLDAGDFYEESAKAALLAGVRAVLLVGTDARNVPQTQSASLCVARYAPYSKLFPRASLIVHQGGVGTTAQAMQAGRPMLVMPYSHDQPDNARRMRRLG